MSNSPPGPRRRRGDPIVPIIVAVLIAVAGIVYIVASGGEDHTKSKPPPTVVSHTPQGVVAAPAPAVQQAASNGETGLGHETISPEDQLHNDAMASPFAPSIEGPPPAATPYQAGCTTRSNTHNFSYRNGVKPSIIPLHLTVSPNVVGWSDVNGNAIFLNRPATQASTNYIIDSEGRCLLTVAETLKAWTQGNFNGASACSFEVVNSGSEAVYAGSAGLNKLARVVHDCAKRWHIPLQRAAVSGSRVTRAGVIDHYHLGLAGGGHVDVHNFGTACRRQVLSPSSAEYRSETWKCVDLVIAMAKAIDKPAAPASVVKWCQGVERFRRQVRAGNKPGAGARKLATRRRELAEKHGYKCGTRDGRSVPVKR